MLRLFEGFDSLKNVTSNLSAIVSGRNGGSAMDMRSFGHGLFLNLFMLPDTVAKGCLGFAAVLDTPSNRLSVIFYLGSQQAFSITFDGRIGISRSGIEVAKTGKHTFPWADWRYFEICMNDTTVTVAIGGRPVMIAPMSATFDRFAFCIPDDQSDALRVTDLFFDDEPLIHGDVTVLRKLSYIPSAIYGIETSDAIEVSNPLTGNPWTFNDLIGKDCRVLAATNVPGSISHSMTVG
jgi:hypothetical protein